LPTCDAFTTMQKISEVSTCGKSSWRNSHKLDENTGECSDAVDGISSSEMKMSRRSIINNTAKAFAMLTAISINPLRSNADENDLTRGGGGLDASTLNEPSIPYKDFLEKLTAGDVTFVEFMAPNGNRAYATLKVKEGETSELRIRIGEGYPIEDPKGITSPAFVVKNVAEVG